MISQLISKARSWKIVNTLEISMPVAQNLILILFTDILLTTATHYLSTTDGTWVATVAKSASWLKACFFIPIPSRNGSYLWGNCSNANVFAADNRIHDMFLKTIVHCFAHMNIITCLTLYLARHFQFFVLLDNALYYVIRSWSICCTIAQCVAWNRPKIYSYQSTCTSFLPCKINKSCIGSNCIFGVITWDLGNNLGTWDLDYLGNRNIFRAFFKQYTF